MTRTAAQPKTSPKKGRANAKPKEDWAQIEVDWRAGIKSKLQMSEEYKVSRAAMNDHFAKLSIERDLKERIRAETSAIVARGSATLRQAFPSAEATATPTAEATQEATATPFELEEEAIIQSNAIMQAEVIFSHRADITRYRRLAQSLLSEIEITSDNKQTFEEVGEMLRSENERGVDKLNDAYQKVIAMPGRIYGFKQLAEVLKTLIGLERQAVGIADNSNGDADKPKEIPSQLHDKDAARRIAFMLLGAERETA